MSRDAIPTLVRHEFERAETPFRVPERRPVDVVIEAIVA